VVRSLAPSARVIATLAHAEALYAEGAAYVLVPPALAAEHLYKLLRDPADDARELFGRA
jgi:hypothetical protein